MTNDVKWNDDGSSLDLENSEDIDSPEEPKEENTYLYKNIENFYERVRFSLNAGASISDEMIDFFENAPLAEKIIKEMIPDYADLEENEYLLFETCIVFQTCYALCPVVSQRRIARQKDPSLEIEFLDKSGDFGCERFLMMVDDLFRRITGEEPSPFYALKVTRPRRHLQCKRCEIDFRRPWKKQL